MWPTILLVIYCLLIVLASLSGGFLPHWLRLTHTRLQLLMSLVAGLMLGVALLHMLPHAVVENRGNLDRSVAWMLAGLLVMFFLMRVFQVHQHGQPEAGEEHGTEDGGRHQAGGSHHLSWIGLAAGLSLHTLIDGIALSAAMAADLRHSPWMLFAGAGTFLAVFAHKPLDALAITTVMQAGGWTLRARALVNAAYALMCPIGAGLFFFLTSGHFAEMQQTIIGAALAFAAGVFLCIALADILPEVTFHTHDRLALSSALLTGVLLAYGIGILECDHSHSQHVGSTHVHGPHCAEHGHP